MPYVNATWCDLNFSLNLNPALGAPWQLWGVKDGDAYLITISELPNDSLSAPALSRIFALATSTPAVRMFLELTTLSEQISIQTPGITTPLRNRMAQ